MGKTWRHRALYMAEEGNMTGLLAQMLRRQDAHSEQLGRVAEKQNIQGDLLDRMMERQDTHSELLVRVAERQRIQGGHFEAAVEKLAILEISMTQKNTGVQIFVWLWGIFLTVATAYYAVEA